MDTLSESMASKFSLTDGESDLVAANPAFAVNPTPVHDLSLIGRVITDKELSINFIRPNLLRLLHPVKGAAVKSITDNVFVIKFNHALDLKKAMGGCPWVLDRHALILEPIDPTTKPEHQELTRLPNRSEHVARLLGNSLGRFVEVPKEADSFYTPYFRIRILVDVRKPLKSGVAFLGVDGEKQWLPVAYERLPTYCFLCGILGHGEVNCPQRYEEGFVEPSEGFPYGSWLRVVVDSRDHSGPAPRISRPGTLRGGGEITRAPTRLGAAIFDHGSQQKGLVKFSENTRPILDQKLEAHGGFAFSSLSSSSNEKSGESKAKSPRRKITVPANKRKAKESVLQDITNANKRPQLKLRDEEDQLTVEAAEQPRRTQ